MDVARPARLALSDWGVAATVATVLLLMGAWRMVPEVTGVYHDDAIYVATAKALAEGQGYRLINLPDAPPQTKYPILYPLLLAGIWKLWPEFPANVAIMQWATLLTGAAAVGLAALYALRFRYLDRSTALALGLLAATSPDLTYFSVITMAEMPFALLSVTALWRLENHLGGEPSRGSACATGALLGLPFLTRSAGVMLIIAGLLLVAWRGRRLGWVALGALAVASPWLTWALGAYGSFEEGPSGYYLDYGGVWTSLAGRHLLAVVMTNLALLMASTGQQLAPVLRLVLDQHSVAMSGAAVLAALLLGSAAWGSVLVSCVRGHVVAVTLTLYGALLLVWPWPPARFLVPVLPLLWLVVASRPLNAPVLRRLAAGVAIAILGINLAVLQVWNAESVRLGYPALGTRSVPEWAAFQRLFAAVRRETKETDVLAGGLDSMLFLYTGRRAIRSFPHRSDALFYGAERPPVGTADEFVERMQRYGIRYVVATPLYFFSEERPTAELTAQLVQQGALEPLYGEEQGEFRFELFRVSAPAPPR